MKKQQIQNVSLFQDELGFLPSSSEQKTHTLRLEIASQGKLGLQNISIEMEVDEVRGNEAIRVFKYELNPKKLGFPNLESAPNVQHVRPA